MKSLWLLMPEMSKQCAWETALLLQSEWVIYLAFGWWHKERLFELLLETSSKLLQ